MTTEQKISILMQYARRCTTSTHALRDNLKTASEHALELAEALKDCYDALYPKRTTNDDGGIPQCEYGQGQSPHFADYVNDSGKWVCNKHA